MFSHVLGYFLEKRDIPQSKEGRRRPCLRTGPRYFLHSTLRYVLHILLCKDHSFLPLHHPPILPITHLTNTSPLKFCSGGMGTSLYAPLVLLNTSFFYLSYQTALQWCSPISLPLDSLKSAFHSQHSTWHAVTIPIILLNEGAHVCTHCV